MYKYVFSEQLLSVVEEPGDDWTLNLKQHSAVTTHM